MKTSLKAQEDWVMKAPAAALLDFVCEELTRISEAMEHFPVVPGHDYGADGWATIQSIDLSRQEIADLCGILGTVRKSAEQSDADLEEALNSVKLENTQSKLSQLFR